MSVDARADSACKDRLLVFASIAERVEEHPTFPSGGRWSSRLSRLRFR